MRAEIDDVIGSRPVSLADRDKMPISDAVLTETLRAGNIAPFALPHTASYDVTWNGYLIPKGATIWPCLDSVMNDDDMFTDPEHFKPERFLDSEGKRLGNEKSVISFSLGKPPHSASKSLAKNIYIYCIFQEFLEENKTIPTYPRVFENVIITFLLLWFFSVSTFSGRRVCLGESLARMEMFLFLVTIIQRFELKSSPTHRTPSLHGVVGTAHAPRPYHICAVERTWEIPESWHPTLFWSLLNPRGHPTKTDYFVRTCHVQYMYSISHEGLYTCTCILTFCVHSCRVYHVHCKGSGFCFVFINVEYISRIELYCIRMHIILCLCMLYD